MSTTATKASTNHSNISASCSPEQTSDKISALQMEDSRAEIIAQRKLNELMNNSPRVQQMKSQQDIVNNSPRALQHQVFQSRLAGLAVPPLQQAQGRGQADRQMKAGVAINNDPALEHEADVMGEKAVSLPVSLKSNSLSALGSDNNIIQQKIGFEFQTTFNKTKFLFNGNNGTTRNEKANEGKKPYYKGKGFNIEGDEGDLELVTKPFEENESGFQEMASVFSWMEVFANAVREKRFPINKLNKEFASASPVGDVLEKGEIDLNVDGRIETDPQVTAGIGLGSLITLAAGLASAPARKRVPEAETVPVLGQDATTENLIRHIGWKDVDIAAFTAPVINASEMAISIGKGRNETMQGFLFMLCLYSLGYSALWDSREKKAANLEKNGKPEEAQKIREQGMEPFWAKLSVGLISRTNLADAFMQLEENDKVWFRENINKIANTIGQASFERRHENEPELFDGNQAGDYRLFGPMANNDEAENYKSWFSIKDWLLNLAPQNGELGVDFSAAYEGMGDVSSRAFSDHGVNDPAFRDPRRFEKDKDASRGRYDLSATPTNIGKATDGGDDRLGGLIIEFRKLGAKIDETQWWAFASNVFKLVVLTNQNATRRDEIVNAFIDS